MLIKFNASRISLHHNLFTDSTQRNPLVSTDNAATPPTDTTADVRNNLVANWQGGSGTIIENGARVNAINNFYASPTSPPRDQEQALFVNPPGPRVPTFTRAGTSAPTRPPLPSTKSATRAARLQPVPSPPKTRVWLPTAWSRRQAPSPRDALDQQHISSIKLPSCATVFVKGLYYHVLQRAASEAEVQTWLGTLGVAPGAARVWLAIRAFFDSPDFREIAVTPSGYVTALYRAALGQDPDSERLAFYTREILVRFNTLLPVFLGSPEFMAARRQMPPDALVLTSSRRLWGAPRTRSRSR